MAATRPLPILDAVSRPWFEAAAEERLLIQRCAACERFQFYPRAHCVHCHAPEPASFEATGRGRLHSFTVVRYTPNEEFAADCPYVFALVELEEGVRMTSRVVDVAFEALRCDMPLVVRFDERDGLTLPVFTVAPEASR